MQRGLFSFFLRVSLPFHLRFVVGGSVLTVFYLEAVGISFAVSDMEVAVLYLLFCRTEAGVSYPMSRCDWWLETVLDILPDYWLSLEAWRPCWIICSLP